MEGTRKEGEEENKGRTAVPEERDKQNMPHQRASTVNDQTTEETRPGMGTVPLQTETEDPAPESTGVVVQDPPQIENEVQVAGMEIYLTISLGVIAYSAGMLGAYHSVASNKLTSVRMGLYDASIWLLYLTFVCGWSMLAIAIRRPFTRNLRTFYICLLCLAAVAGTYALGFGAYLLLPESTISLVIICVTPIALLLVAMILFKDKIVRLFRF